jgi:hypothetical protein
VKAVAASIEPACVCRPRRTERPLEGEIPGVERVLVQTAGSDGGMNAPQHRCTRGSRA